MEKKLSFKKRISLVKANVAIKLIESKELSKLGSGSARSGYYNLSTIVSALQPELLKNDLDLEITMLDNHVDGIWVDCENDSDLERKVTFDLTRLSNIIKSLERLPQMQNAIQTEGSIKTYFRRYALTAFLNLPATDEIDGNNNNNNNKNQSTPPKAKTKPKPKPESKPTNLKLLSEDQKKVIAEMDSKIVEFVLSKSKYKTVNEVPENFYNDFHNQIVHYTKKRDEKEKENKPTKTKTENKNDEKVTKDDVLMLVEEIKRRLLDVNDQDLAIKAIYGIKDIMHMKKSDFDVFWKWYSDEKTTNRDIENKFKKWKDEKAK